MITSERIAYGGWPHCYRLANPHIELVVTTDVGPRIIRLAFSGQANEFAEMADHLGKTGGDEWRSYGGHRLWHAPEARPRTYAPDNDPVTLQQDGDRIRLIQAPEASTGIQKEIDIRLAPDRPHVQITHRLRNHNPWTIELAAWALSVMAPAGVAILPLPPRGSHAENLTPTSSLALWPYTDMTDARWTWGSRFIMLRQEPGNARPQKAGLLVHDGWMAYARAGHLFVKRFAPPAGSYPDFNCNCEVFTNQRMLEMETLGPLTKLAPGETVEHNEDWFLLDGVPQPRSEDEIEQHVLPRVQELMRDSFPPVA